MNSNLSEVTATDEDVLILNVPDDVRERRIPDTLRLLRTDRSSPEYVDSEKWCGDQRTKYAVLKVEAASFALAAICVTLIAVLVA